MKVRGEIAAHNLTEWWLSTFSPEEQRWMKRVYAPLGAPPNSLVVGVRAPRSNAFEFLSNAAGWFNKPGGQRCAMLFAEKSLSNYSEAIPILDRHFGLATLCKVFYRWRDVEDGAFEKAILVCESCIQLAPLAAREFIKDGERIPAHYCYRQLRIIEEKRGNYQRAIELCEKAKLEGWADDWDGQIARNTRKLNA